MKTNKKEKGKKGNFLAAGKAREVASRKAQHSSR